MLWIFRIRGSILRHIWWQVILLMLFTAGIIAINEYGNVTLSFGTGLTPVIGVVLGLLLGVRTSSSYSRYEEGRGLWTAMNKSLRTFAMTVWHNVQGDEAIDIVEKKTIINLCLAFAIATKHYLREEYSYQYADLKDLIVSLNKYAIPAATKSLDSQIQAPPVQTNKVEKTPTKVVKKMKLAAYDIPTPTNIPMEIICHLQSYVINHLLKNKIVQSVSGTVLNAGVGGLIDCLTNFERIVRTPIPMAFSVQLHVCIWMYLLSLPLQFAVKLEWWSIPMVGIGAFCMLGVLAIGVELENPFGLEDNDLPLDDYCTVLQEELEMLTSQSPITADSWLSSPLNRPFNFATQCKLTATELSQKSADDVQEILAENARARIIPLANRG